MSRKRGKWICRSKPWKVRDPVIQDDWTFGRLRGSPLRKKSPNRSMIDIGTDFNWFNLSSESPKWAY